MTPPPDISEEAVERVARLHWVAWDAMPANLKPSVRTAIRDVLQASGALYLTKEEKRALLRFSQAGDDESIWDFTKAEREQFWSARQKLEESL